MRQPAAAFVPALVALASVVLGVGTVVYVGLVSDSLLRVAVLPLVLALLALLIVDKRSLFILIMLFRAVCDPIFDAAKFSIGGVNLGVGAALNALMILIALMFMIERPAMQASSPGATRMRIPLWVLAVLPVLALAVARSPDPGNALRTALVLLSYAAVFVIPFHLVKTNDDARMCIRIVLLSSLLPVLYAFVDIAMNWSGGGPDGFRLRSTFTHPNIFAFYLLLVISLLLYRFKTRTQQLAPAKRWLFGAYMLLLLAMLVLTKTRSAWIACFAIFGLYAAIYERRMLFYLLLAPLPALLLPEVRDRLLDLTATNVYDPYAQLNSFDWRVEIWKSGLAWMQPVSLLIGYGLNAFTYYSPQFFPLAGNSNPGAHNVYVQWFFETGTLGMLCFAWVFYRLLRTLARRVAVDGPGTTILISLVVAYLVVCASDNMIDYLSFNWYFWFAVGGACASIGVLNKPQAVAASDAGQTVPPSAPPPQFPRRRRRALAHHEQSTVTE